MLNHYSVCFNTVNNGTLSVFRYKKPPRKTAAATLRELHKFACDYRFLWGSRNAKYTDFLVSPTVSILLDDSEIHLNPVTFRLYHRQLRQAAMYLLGKSQEPVAPVSVSYIMRRYLSFS